MDHALVEFRNVAARENCGRRGLRRRYSLALQQQAVDYWRMRQRAGDGMRTVAAALCVAHRSLQGGSKHRRARAVFGRCTWSRQSVRTSSRTLSFG